jgi:hypothetical protein
MARVAARRRLPASSDIDPWGRDAFVGVKERMTTLVSRDRALGALGVGAFLGLAAWLAVGSAGLLALRTTWAAYAAVEPFKAYSPAMLWARLGVACIACAAAGVTASRAAGVRGAIAAGTLLVVLSLPIHLIEVWAEYPAWYHVTYLLLLIPVTGLAGLVNRR